MCFRRSCFGDKDDVVDVAEDISSVVLDFDGDFTDYLGVITGTPNNTVPGSLSVVLPAIAEFSGYHALNSQWAVHYGIQWIQYSKFEELRGTGDQCTPGNKQVECVVGDEFCFDVR